jgi:hypothetical protein
LNVESEEAADAVEYRLLYPLESRLIRLFADGEDLGDCKIVESPVGLINRDSEGPAMCLVVFCSQLGNRDASVLILYYLPQTISLLASLFL